MRRQITQPIGDAIAEFLRESGLEKPLLEKQLVECWPVVMGPSVARLTRRVELNNGVLFVYLNSAALKAELFICRRELVNKLNEHVGSKVIEEVRLLG